MVGQPSQGPHSHRQRQLLKKSFTTQTPYRDTCHDDMLPQHIPRQALRCLRAQFWLCSQHAVDIQQHCWQRHTLDARFTNLSAAAVTGRNMQSFFPYNSLPGSLGWQPVCRHTPNKWVRDESNATVCYAFAVVTAAHCLKTVAGTCACVPDKPRTRAE